MPLDATVKIKFVFIFRLERHDELIADVCNVTVCFCEACVLKDGIDMGQKQTLFFTATEGRLDDLKWVLYEKKVSPNLRDHESQEVALHLAASRGHAECVKLLLKAGE